MNASFMESFVVLGIELVTRLVATSVFGDDELDVAISWLSELTRALVII
ncbi:hypothetical protein [Enterobacter roggenkampii]|nr:hypothetical protein [Enterobacter roggenkampii]